MHQKKGKYLFSILHRERAYLHAIAIVLYTAWEGDSVGLPAITLEWKAQSKNK